MSDMGDDLINYSHYMRRALILARAAADAGEVPVGALIVREGQVVARSSNRTEKRQSGLAHAELLAIAAAQEKLAARYLSDCTLFVTMEPCPMCAGALVLARVGTVVYGCPDSRWGACGSLFNVPEHKQTGFRPLVVGGILEDECRALLQQFFRERREP